MNYQFAVWIPSLQQDIYVSELTTKQQKELAKTLMSPYVCEFTKNLHTLLQENIQSQINLNNLTLLDKFVILAKLRAVSVNSEAEYTFKCEGCKKDITAKVNLFEIIDKINHLEVVYILSEIQQPFIVDFGLPTVESELSLGEDAIVNLEKQKETPLGELYSEFYLRDLLFFIQKITIFAEKSKVIEFSKLTAQERLKILERLPAKMLKKVWERIQGLKESLAKVSLLELDCFCGARVVSLKLGIGNAENTTFLKSLFNVSIDEIFKNIYYMTKVLGFDYQSIEQMTPAERDIYWGYHVKDEKRRQEQQLDTNQTTV